jgi:glycosyltransferase involved in cell wall biosynthesis
MTRLNRFGAPTLPVGGTADVTLLLEGTYPFVSGGVSTWVHQIISGLHDLTFAVVFVGGSPDRYDKLRYDLPRNLVHLEEHYLSDVPRKQHVITRPGDPEFARRSAALHDAFRAGSAACPGGVLERVVQMLIADPTRHEHDFLFGERAWDEMCNRYERAAPDRSFLEYFWTVRSMHAPLFLMARAAAGAPQSRAFHAVSTGFAGFLGVLLRRARKRPLVLTEHGIYTKERRIELLQATWIRDDAGEGAGSAGEGIGYFRQMWIRFFEALGRLTYDAADPIVSLFEGNRERQHRDGADPARTRVVPNGIDLERFTPLRAQRPSAPPRILGLIGRVVPIKDIKTFLRAMRIVATRLPDARGWIVGPDDEDREYAEECRSLAQDLGLHETVSFLGLRRVDEILPKLGLNVLTSISEAQPLVILEGLAAGVPCVASDVGCCRELLEGAGDEDRALRAGGHRRRYRRPGGDCARRRRAARTTHPVLGRPARRRRSRRALLYARQDARALRPDLRRCAGARLTWRESASSCGGISARKRTSTRSARTSSPVSSGRGHGSSRSARCSSSASGRKQLTARSARSRSCSRRSRI